jgi:replicative DNA helicase
MTPAKGGDRVSVSPFASLADLLNGWSDDVLHGKPPVRWPAGSGPLARFPIGPGLICLIGGPPGAGKTALADQLVFDAVRLTPELRALVTCCEMPPAVLLDRQLARLSGVPYRAIRDRALTAEHRAAVAAGFATLNAIRNRLVFHTGPFTLDAVAASADGCEADLILVDYLQRLQAPGPHRDKRSMTNSILDTFRAFADAGRGLLLLASVGRQPSGKHGRSSYDGLGLASFKETGECEYTADDAFILTPPADGFSALHHVKARHTEPADVALRPRLDVMAFDPVSATQPAAERSDLIDAARRLWKDGAKGDAG